MERGEWLRHERGYRHLSQADLATALGISIQTVSRWEREKAFPQAHYRLQLSQFLGIAPQELFGNLSAQEQDPSPPLSLDLWNVPHQRNMYFTDRDENLLQLHTWLYALGKHTIRQPVAICGIPGVGKTQLALEYVSRFHTAYEAVFWVYAQTQESIYSDVLKIAQMLHLREKAEQDEKPLVEKVFSWLQTHSRWLLVFDQLEDLALLDHLKLPREKGSLLLTTRSQFTGTTALTLSLQPFSEGSADLFLLRRSKVLSLDHSLKEASELDRMYARRIVQLLGGLPLALDQAGAYIEETGCTLVMYLEQYSQCRKQLLQRRGRIESAEHPASFVTTLLLVFQQLEHLHPLAASTLQLCAFFDATEIPEELLLAALPFLTGTALSPVEQAQQLEEVVVTLRSLSLICRHTQTRSFYIHPLIKVVLRENLDPGSVELWIERSIRTLNAVFPEETSWPLSERYLPHVQVCQHLLEHSNLSFPEAVQILHKAAAFLLSRG